MTDWWNNYDDVLHLAGYLKEKNTFQSVNDLYDFFEEPWKWEPEWNEMQEELEEEMKIYMECRE